MNLLENGEIEWVFRFQAGLHNLLSYWTLPIAAVYLPMPFANNCEVLIINRQSQHSFFHFLLIFFVLFVYNLIQQCLHFTFHISIICTHQTILLISIEIVRFITHSITKKNGAKIGKRVAKPAKRPIFHQKINLSDFFFSKVFFCSFHFQKLVLSGTVRDIDIWDD